MIHGYSCQCGFGFEHNGQDWQQSGQSHSEFCHQIDDCHVSNGVDACGTAGLHTCTDGLGTHTCSCASGYEVGVNASVHTSNNTCVNIDDCAADPCGDPNDGFVCTDLLNDYACSCPSGYEVDVNTTTHATNLTCINIDDCNNNPCGRNYTGSSVSYASNLVTCVDKLNAHECQCDSVAFRMVVVDGNQTCVENNDCMDNPCHPSIDVGHNNVHCFDQIGNHTCQCGPGFHNSTVEWIHPVSGDVFTNQTCVNNENCGDDPCGTENNGFGGRINNCTDEVRGWSCACGPGPRTPSPY